MQEITPSELAAMLNQPMAVPVLLLDVREVWEWELTHLSGSVHIPMNLIPIRHNELPDETLIVAICHHGVRSLQVANYLKNVGFDQVVSLQSGLDGWALQVDPSIRRY